MKFKATEIGFENGMGGASNSSCEDEYHYILFSIQNDDDNSENHGVYFEYDDQINGEIDQVQKIIIGLKYLEFSLGEDESIIIDCCGFTKQWDDLVSGIYSIFPNNLITKV